MNLTEERLQYLELLSQKFPSPAQVSTEIINLNAILGLPKGTEHFISDIHGEYRLFLHILKNASGSVRRKIFQCFSEEEMSTAEMDELATLIYYPEEKLALLKEAHGSLNQVWYTTTLLHLVQVCRKATSKYTRSKVRKAMPHDFAYIIDELLNYSEADEDDNRTTYVHNIVHSIIEIGSADAFIIAISELIQHAVIDKLHIVGDVFDRGNGAHKVMDTLMEYNNVDIQWGNHDILWMAAAMGQWASIANVLRNCIRYNNFDSLEDGYGINLRPLTQFALETYRDDPCTLFLPSHSKRETELKQRRENDELTAKVHKAISVIQFKLEGRILRDHPEYHMSHRLFWETMDSKTHRIQIDGHWYDLKDSHFPTLSPEDPYRLSPEEETVMNDLAFSFRNSIRMQRHLKFLLDNGSIYKVNNGYLLYHGCIPMNEDGTLHYSTINGKKYAGRAMLEAYNHIIRVASYASIAMHWLPGIIQRFREECPDVDVDIRMADHVDVPYELLAQGKMDAILVSPQDEGQYEWVHLADDPMFAVLPRDFDTQGMTAFPLAAFEARDFIMPSQGFDKDIMRIFNRIGVKPHILPTWVDDPTVISMVSHGLGVSMMTELTVRGRTDGVKLLPVEPASSRELGLAVRSLDAASDGLRHFIDCTKRVVAEMQP